MPFKMRKMLELQMSTNSNQQEFTILVVCKNVIEKFVIIVLLLKESMILLRERKV